jgi:hypothetical protein
MTEETGTPSVSSGDGNPRVPCWPVGLPVAARQAWRAAGVQAGRPSVVLVSSGMGWRVRARRKLSGLS